MRKFQLHTWLYLVVAAIVLIICSCGEDEEIVEAAIVERVIDGDTIELDTGEMVRYIGVDAPELTEAFGHEAWRFNRSLVEGEKVRLEYDEQATDQYGRTLAYVYLMDGTFVNAELVEEGYAEVSTFPPNVKYVAIFLEREQQAKSQSKGLWESDNTPPPDEPKANDYTVYITKTGTKYHRAGCRYLKDSKIPIKKSEAISRGYTPCSVCRP